VADPSDRAGTGHVQPSFPEVRAFLGGGITPSALFSCQSGHNRPIEGMKREKPDFQFETCAIEAGARYVVGVDEAGRGPLAGPVTAAAVWLDPAQIPEGLNDSKKLSDKKREALYAQLLECAHVSVVHVSVREIEEINIRAASLLAMERAVAQLPQVPDHVLIDGNALPKNLPCPAEAIVKGDARSLSIAAASIVAKTCRDRIMVDLAQQHPGYEWEKNMGYPAPAHLEALRNLGVTPHHRRTFKPVHNILYQVKLVSD